MKIQNATTKLVYIVDREKKENPIEHQHPQGFSLDRRMKINFQARGKPHNAIFFSFSLHHFSIGWLESLMKIHSTVLRVIKHESTQNRDTMLKTLYLSLFLHSYSFPQYFFFLSSFLFFSSISSIHYFIQQRLISSRNSNRLQCNLLNRVQLELNSTFNIGGKLRVRDRGE